MTQNECCSALPHVWEKDPYYPAIFLIACATERKNSQRCDTRYTELHISVTNIASSQLSTESSITFSIHLFPPACTGEKVGLAGSLKAWHLWHQWRSDPKVSDGMQRGTFQHSSSLDLSLSLQLPKPCVAHSQLTCSLSFLGCWWSWCVLGKESETYWDMQPDLWLWSDPMLTSTDVGTLM